MAPGIVISSVRDALAVAAQILESAQEEVVWLVPSSMHSLSMRHGFVEKTSAFIQQGGVSRGVVPTSKANASHVQMSLDNGEDVRHSDGVHEFFLYVGDRQRSISAINIGSEEYTLATPIVAFWSEDPAYAEYLLTAFEGAWSTAEPAQQRIRELEEQSV